MTGTTTDHDKLLLQAFGRIEERHEVPTVQAAAIEARLTFMEAYDLVNTLFTAGYLTHDLRLRDAGKKAIK